MTSPLPDHVVLLDEDARPTGETVPRDEVHTTDTPFHLAFSCYLFDVEGRLLLTRRALSKRTWPGVWTNSFCGHPRPGEASLDAVQRHAGHELGLTVDEVACVLPGFRYRAVDASGIVENEHCPVYVARCDVLPTPHPDEVMDTRWVGVEELRAAVRTAGWALSPWLVEQVAALDAASTGWDPAERDSAGREQPADHPQPH